MNTLKKALSINAIFSGFSGLTLILGNQYLADIFEITPQSVFWITGIVLIYFAITIWYETKKLRKWAVIWIIIQDFLWVIASTFLFLWNPFTVSAKGNLIIAIIALVVLAMAINQSLALKKTIKFKKINTPLF